MKQQFKRRWVVSPPDKPYKILYKSFASEGKARAFVRSIGLTEFDYVYKKIRMPL